MTAGPRTLIAIATISLALAACGGSSAKQSGASVSGATVPNTTNASNVTNASKGGNAPNGTGSTNASGSGPQFTNYSANLEPCPQSPLVGSPPGDGRSVNLPPPVSTHLTLTWDTKNAARVYDAVDDVNGIYEDHLASAGTATFERKCRAEHHTYYVVAVGRDGTKVVKSTTDSGKS